MLTIAAASFKEASSKKIFHLLGVLTLLYLIVLSVLIHFMSGSTSGLDSISIFANVSTIVSLLGFYFSSMLVAFLTVMLSIGLISSEIESGTIYTVVTKPIKRSTYVLGKFAGTSMLITCYSVLLYLAIVLLPLTVNVSFIKTLGMSNLAGGLLFFIIEPLAILSLCIYGSTVFKTLNNGIFVISLYILGLIGGVMEQVGIILKSESLNKIGILASLISPFDSIYRRMMSSLFSSTGLMGYANGLGVFTGSQTTPSNWMIIYVLIYLSGFVYFAVKKFSKMDL